MAVSDAIKSGRIGPPAVIRVEGQPKIADVALADEQWARNTDPVRAANALAQGTTAGPPQPLVITTSPPRVLVAGPPPPMRGSIDAAPPTIDAPPVGEPEGTATATERLKSAQADLAELKRDEARGLLVLASEVEKKVSDTFAACRTRLLSIPSRARQSLPHLANADVIVLEELLREALEDLSS